MRGASKHLTANVASHGTITLQDNYTHNYHKPTTMLHTMNDQLARMLEQQMKSQQLIVGQPLMMKGR
jgi:hypothetical protein